MVAFVLKNQQQTPIIKNQSWALDMHTVEPHYNEDLGTTKITLLYQGFKKNQRNIMSWDQQNYLEIRWFCYIQALFNEFHCTVELHYKEDLGTMKLQ